MTLLFNRYVTKGILMFLRSYFLTQAINLYFRGKFQIKMPLGVNYGLQNTICYRSL